MGGGALTGTPLVKLVQAHFSFPPLPFSLQACFPTPPPPSADTYPGCGADGGGCVGRAVSLCRCTVALQEIHLNPNEGGRDDSHSPLPLENTAHIHQTPLLLLCCRFPRPWQAVAEVKVGKDTPVLDAAGKAGFFLWRSTYVVKQARVSKGAFSSTSLCTCVYVACVLEISLVLCALVPRVF